MKPQTILGTVGNPLFLIFILCIIIIVSCGRQEKGTTNVSVTEEMKKDTIYSTEGVLIIDIPHSAFVQRDSYEEGFFVSYFLKKYDSHYGFPFFIFLHKISINDTDNNDI